jgi:hypothetical protein
MRIADDLSADKIASSAVARNTFMLCSKRLSATACR